VTEALQAGEEVQITGFGKFSVKERKAREGRNPQTGQKMKIAAQKVRPSARATPSIKPSRAFRIGVSLTEAMAKAGHCQVRSRTGNPCPRSAEVEILGIAFCGPCARQQETYFVIGELTQQTQGFRSKPLAEALKRMRR
jgi:nucleoid DNA-binding protein